MFFSNIPDIGKSNFRFITQCIVQNIKEFPMLSWSCSIPDFLVFLHQIFVLCVDLGATVARPSVLSQLYWNLTKKYFSLVYYAGKLLKNTHITPKGQGFPNLAIFWFLMKLFPNINQLENIFLQPCKATFTYIFRTNVRCCREFFKLKINPWF